MVKEPNCRNTEPDRVWQCSEGFLSRLTANLWAAAERGRARGQQRSPKQLLNAPSSPSQESKGHSNKSIVMIIYCHSFRHWCVLLLLLHHQPAAGRHKPAGVGAGARWRGPTRSAPSLSTDRKHVWNFQVMTFVLQPSQGCRRKPGISAPLSNGCRQTPLSQSLPRVQWAHGSHCGQQLCQPPQHMDTHRPTPATNASLHKPKYRLGAGAQKGITT